MEIKIAPNYEEIVISDNSLSTEWNGGIVYKANLKHLRKLHGDDYLIENFRTAIALCSKWWQVERLLNSFFHLKGKIQ